MTYSLNYNKYLAELPFYDKLPKTFDSLDDMKAGLLNHLKRFSHIQVIGIEKNQNSLLIRAVWQNYTSPDGKWRNKAVMFFITGRKN